MKIKKIMARKGVIITLALLFCIVLFACVNPGGAFTKVLVRAMGHYKTPEYESAASILKVTEERELKFDRLFRFADLHSVKNFQEKGLLSIPFIHFYNREKRLMTVASGDECKWNLMGLFLESDSTQLLAGDSLMFNFLMANIQPIQIKADQDTFQHYVIAGWANYVPKLSERLFQQTNEIKETMGDRVCISYINLDFQEEWKAEMDSMGIEK